MSSTRPSSNKPDSMFESVKSWSFKQVGEWLRSKGMNEEIQRRFYEEVIDGETLLLLRDDDICLICQHITIPMEIRRKLEVYIHEIQLLHSNHQQKQCIQEQIVEQSPFRLTSTDNIQSNNDSISTFGTVQNNNNNLEICEVANGDKIDALCTYTNVGNKKEVVLGPNHVEIQELDIKETKNKKRPISDVDVDENVIHSPLKRRRRTEQNTDSSEPMHDLSHSKNDIAFIGAPAIQSNSDKQSNDPNTLEEGELSQHLSEIVDKNDKNRRLSSNHNHSNLNSHTDYRRYNRKNRKRKKRKSDDCSSNKRRKRSSKKKKYRSNDDNEYIDNRNLPYSQVNEHDTHSHAQHWSDMAKQRMWAMHRRGRTNLEIAKYFGRTECAIYVQIEKRKREISEGIEHDYNDDDGDDGDDSESDSDDQSSDDEDDDVPIGQRMQSCQSSNY